MVFCCGMKLLAKSFGHDTNHLECLQNDLMIFIINRIINKFSWSKICILKGKLRELLDKFFYQYYLVLPFSHFNITMPKFIIIVKRIAYFRSILISLICQQHWLLLVFWKIIIMEIWWFIFLLNLITCFAFSHFPLCQYALGVFFNKVIPFAHK